MIEHWTCGNPPTIRHKHVYCTCTVSSRKCALPFLHTTFRQKWGEGVCSNIQFVSCIRPLPPFFVVLNMHEFNNRNDWLGLLKEQQLHWTCTSRKLAFSVRATKIIPVARKQGDSNFVCTYLRTRLTTELNQKLTKHSQKTFDTGHTRGENTYVIT